MPRVLLKTTSTCSRIFAGDLSRPCMCHAPSFEIKISTGLCVSDKCFRICAPLLSEASYSGDWPPRMTPMRSESGKVCMRLLYQLLAFLFVESDCKSVGFGVGKDDFPFVLQPFLIA